MRLGTLEICTALAVFASGSVATAAQPDAHVVDDGSLTLAGTATARAGRDARFLRAAASKRAAWSRLEAETGTAWASWDVDTQVPSRILLSGIDVPDAVADPSAARRFAEAFLARHIDLLAPGAAPSDFVLVSNDLSAGMRSLGFIQHHAGVPVVGGQLSFRFKRDRLFMIGSEAFPNIAIPARTTTVDDAGARTKARDFVETSVRGRFVASKADAGTMILPIVERNGAIQYHEVRQTEVELEHPPSRFTVWVDAETGDAVARRSTLFHGTSGILFDVPQRGPLGPRINAAAPNLTTSVGTTDGAGVLSYAGGSIGVDLVGATGPFVSVDNASGPVITTAFVVTDGESGTLSNPGDESIDSQFSTFVHASLAKSYVRNIAPDLAWLDQQLPVVVNIDDECNAFSDGDSINFYLASASCENTGRLSDVVYHEFGHSVHAQSLLPGVGQFNVSLSEGVSDYLAATMTGDTGLGRGFFFDNTPLRDFDPDGFEYRWPDDRGEVHAEGRIIGGALWDLRELMINKLGVGGGVAYTDRLYYETTRRAVDIPSMYAEALAFDDDDGNLANGTPNGCEINAAYGPHGLFSAGEGNERVSLVQDPGGAVVQLALSIPNFPGCPITAAPTIEWRLREEPGTGDSFAMTALPDSTYTGAIPTQVAGTVVEYRVRLNYSNGAEGPLPDNFVDPWYEVFFGDVIPLQCLGDPWQTTIEGNGNWVLGAMDGDTAGSDPPTGFDNGLHLYQPGTYLPFSNSTFRFDPVSTQGYTNVRLQFQRWLTIEDAFFDEATILEGDTPVWSNHASGDEREATFHHIDKEWRFRDIDLSEFVDDGAVDLAFAVSSDGGLDFGGWNVAAMCVVAFDEGLARCGDGTVDPTEECDDGNLVDGDGCTASCILEGDGPATTTNDSIGTSDSVGESGSDGDFETDTDGDDASLLGDGLRDRGCACATTGDSGPVPALFGLVLLGLARRRRQA